MQYVRVLQDENNPFSESYQQRENIEKQHGFVGQKQELQRPQADAQVKPQLVAVSQSPLDGAGVEMKASAQGVSQMPPGLIPAPPSQKNGGMFEFAHLLVIQS